MNFPVIPIALVIAILLALQDALKDYPAEWAPIATMIIALIIQILRVYGPKSTPEINQLAPPKKSKRHKFLLG